MLKPKMDEGKEFYCSFCDKSQQDVKKLVAGPRVYICDECITRCNDVLSGSANNKEEISRCAFCNKTEHEVKRLVIGSKVNICDECVELCNDIVKDETNA